VTSCLDVLKFYRSIQVKNVPENLLKTKMVIKWSGKRILSIGKNFAVGVNNLSCLILPENLKTTRNIENTKIRWLS
jgi:hypothetical protein